MSRADGIITEMERLILEMTRAVENLRSDCSEDTLKGLEETAGPGTILVHPECLVGLGGIRAMIYDGDRYDPCEVCGEEMPGDRTIYEVDRNDLPKGRTS